MKNIFQIAFLISLFTLNACSEDFFESTVEIEIPEHIPTLAVSGVLTEGYDSIRFLVTTSQSINDLNAPKPLEGANIQLFKDGNLLPAFTSNGDFFETILNSSDLEAGSTYRLEVEHPDFEAVSSTQIMPEKTKIDSFIFEKDGTLDEFGDIVDELSIEFTDDPNEENYYMFQFIEEGVRIDSWNQDTFKFKDARYIETRDPNVVYGFNGYSGFGSGRVPMLSDASFNGKKIKVIFSSYSSDWSNQTTEKITAYLTSISKERYFYLSSLGSYYDSDGNPFVEPVNVAGNIENGLGAFGTQNIDSKLIEF